MVPPKRILDCPIIDALVELRFEVNVHRSAVFGIFYNAIRETYTNVEELPILQIPEAVRGSDNFKNKPHYKIKNEKFVLQVGHDVVTISCSPEYQGWESFSSEIFRIISVLNSLKIIKKVTRLGIRYVNFFKGNIFDHTELEIKLKKETIKNLNTVVRTEIKKEGFTSTLQIGNSVKMDDNIGSIVDIDTFKFFSSEDFFEKFKDIINSGHDVEKVIFFDLLKPEYLKTLKPEY